MTRRPLAVLGLAGLTLAGVSACAPFHAGAAATVGSARISTAQLQSAADRVTAARPATAPTGVSVASEQDVQRNSLGNLVVQQVLLRTGPLATPLQTAAARTQIATGLVFSAFVQQQQSPPTSIDSQLAGEVATYYAESGYDTTALAAIRATVSARRSGADVGGEVATAYAQTADHAGSVVRLYVGDDELQVFGLVDKFVQSPAAGIAAAEAADIVPVTTSLTAAYVQAAVSSGRVFQSGAVIGPLELADGRYAVAVVQSTGQLTLQQEQQPLSSAVQQAQVARWRSTYAADERAAGVKVSPRFGGWNPTGTNVAGASVGTVGDAPGALSYVPSAG